MKLTATGLLIVALALFVTSYLIPSSNQADQFLRAGSEAAMVGGLADWFAVTALFRRPLGLPIPHTALIPTKKDQLAENLGGFITEFFLDADTLAGHLESIDLLGRMGSWLADPRHARMVTDEALQAAHAALESVRAEALTRAAVSAVDVDMQRRSYARQAGELLAITVESGSYEPVADLVLQQLALQLRQPEFVERARQLIDRRHWLAGLLVTDNRLRKIADRVADQFDLAATDHREAPFPELRGMLTQLAEHLCGNEETARRFDAMCHKQLHDPELQAWLSSVIDGGLVALRATLEDPDSDVADIVTRFVCAWADRAQHDETFRAEARDFVYKVVLQRVQANADEFTRFITDTVAKWDAEDTSKRIETAVGRDLQFIRINGTVVGAIAGLAIHALSLGL